MRINLKFCVLGTLYDEAARTIYTNALIAYDCHADYGGIKATRLAMLAV